MSFRARDSGGNPNKIELGEPRKFGGPDNDKQNRDDDRFDSSRGRRPIGRGGRPSPGRDRSYDRNRDYGYGRDEPIGRDRSPLRRSDDRFSDRYGKEDSFSKRDEHGRKDPDRQYYGSDSGRDRYMENRPRHESGSGNFGRFEGPSSMPYKSRSMNYIGNSPSKGPYYEGFPKPNECEIIVVNKQQRAYSESVEERVKSFGILVDILFLKDEALLTQTIDDIARRGSLYAMVISPQNETHRSVTVNILHGTPQEHRNMPLEDALKLLSRNFHEHIRTQREHMERERAERGPYVGVVSADREIQFLLRMLADGRWISLSEINLVIRYLSERRDKMQSGNDDRGPPGHMPLPPANIKMDSSFKLKDDSDVSQKEQDLQNRIINIMNQGAPVASGTGSSLGLNRGLPEFDMPPSRQNPTGMSDMRPLPGLGSGIKSGRPGLDDNPPGPLGLDSNLQTKDSLNKPVFSSSGPNALSDSSPSTYINFDNPSVQKALDNLMQSGPSLLKNISLSTSAVTNTPPNPVSTTPAPNDNPGMSVPPDPLMNRGSMGPPRSSDMTGNLPRTTGNIDATSRSTSNIPDFGNSRGNNNIPGIGGGIGSGRGGYGNMQDMNNNPRGFGDSNMSDMVRMGPPRGGMGPTSGRDLGPPPNIGPGANFANQNQYNKYPGPGQQQGNFGGSYNSGPGMGGMSRQNYNGPPGIGNMGSGPRRY